jgi:hypothetical protein
MPNVLGKIKATPKTTAPAGGGGPVGPGGGEGPAAPADTSLPDPTQYAKWTLLGLLLVALVVALVWNGIGHVGTPFTPAEDESANFALFAGFYAAAQVIERLLELISPSLPLWEVPDPPAPGGPPTEVQAGTAKAAQVKADRAAVVHGIAAALGVAASCAFGLFFLRSVGFQVSNTIDTFATGLLISAGTKPLHDFISGLQSKNTPTTGTTT